jgi:hypothetical protein
VGSCLLLWWLVALGLVPTWTGLSVLAFLSSSPGLICSVPRRLALGAPGLCPLVSGLNVRDPVSMTGSVSICD